MRAVERLPVDPFLVRILRTDFKDKPADDDDGKGSGAGEDAYKGLGGGGRRAALIFDIVDAFILGAKNSIGIFEDKGSYIEEVEEVATYVVEEQDGEEGRLERDLLGAVGISRWDPLAGDDCS